MFQPGGTQLWLTAVHAICIVGVLLCVLTAAACFWVHSESNIWTSPWFARGTNAIIGALVCVLLAALASLVALAWEASRAR